MRRIEASGFSEKDASPLAEVSLVDLRPAVEIVRSLPSIEIDPVARALVKDGRPLQAPDGSFEEDDLVALVADQELVAVYRQKGPRLIAEKVLSS